MKTSSKWVIGVLVILGIFAYRYYQEQACYLLTVRVIPYTGSDSEQQRALLAEKLASSSVRDLYCSSRQSLYTMATFLGTTLHAPVIVDDRLTERTGEFLRDYGEKVTSFFKDVAKQYKREVYIIVDKAMINDLLDYLEVPRISLPTSCCTIITFIYNPCSGHMRYSGSENL